MCYPRSYLCKTQDLLFNPKSNLRHSEKDHWVTRIICPIYADLWTGRFFPTLRNWSTFQALIYFDIIIILFIFFLDVLCFPSFPPVPSRLPEVMQLLTVQGLYLWPLRRSIHRPRFLTQKLTSYYDFDPVRIFKWHHDLEFIIRCLKETLPAIKNLAGYCFCFLIRNLQTLGIFLVTSVFGIHSGLLNSTWQFMLMRWAMVTPYIV